MQDPGAKRNRPAARLALAVLAVAAAGAQRVHAARSLPVDHDEDTYLRAGFRYAELMAAGRWGAIPYVAANPEHPPLAKLAFGAALRATGAPEPDWRRVKVGRPVPREAWPAFAAGRFTCVALGTTQVALLAAVHPMAALIVALDPYHAKYTSQAYLEALPGLLALLAVLALAHARAGPASARALPTLAFALAGAAAAGKHAFGLVAVLTLAPFALAACRRRPLALGALAAAAVAAFVALDPALWPDPFGRAAEALRFHWQYSQGGDVARAAFPWWQQVAWLLGAAPARSHPAVFPAGAAGAALLPLAASGGPIAWRRHPIFASWAAIAVAFLLAWPTKWPHYLLVATPALAVCAADAITGAAAWIARRVRGQPAGVQ